MPLYEIPLFRRFVNVTKNASCFYKKEEIMSVDEVGIFLHYDEESQEEVHFIRRHLVCREHGKCFIEASSPREAIKKFHIEYDGARVGGKKREARAMWINEKEYIFELPHCELLHRNKEGEFICGELSEEGEGNQGEWGMCVLEGYSTPPNCVISEFYSNWQYTSTIVKISGFKVVQPIKYCYRA